ncbi:hypothetical protein BABINDRAFT_160096 [Babjeviella inositovora NRRL Y-12698]|uniref:Exosome complex protein n=1 Tax=Babjeviella inositovora NRRL Y-12698 TaxID=984486 RepID=A0A1E3QW22_9ASCO|nr:uncharacterized protein BABINDRAFT_160096 [Babjeviella inositovora NRRL Y-12698]ODQ81865.1 hypothetical protein BABINDRAFT_160096 [Babjeviella inositovora NRRL Y-12698]
MDNIENVKLYAQALDSAVDSLTVEIKALVAQTLNERSAAITPLERAELTNNYAYSISSLFFSFLKASGVDTNKHGIMDELSRVKSYMATVKQAKAGSEDKSADAELAKRYLKSALGQGNSTVVTGAHTPAISSAHFTGTHTKFAKDNETPKAVSVSKKDVKKVGAEIKGKKKTKKTSKVTKP